MPSREELLSGLADMPEEGGSPGGMDMGAEMPMGGAEGMGPPTPPGMEGGMEAPMGGGAGGGEGGAPPGGPGIDTPQEQQAVQLLTQGAQLLRQAADTEPSIRFIIDRVLQDAFLSVTKHYGIEEEGKLALKQAQLQGNKQRSSGLTGPPVPPGGIG